MRGCCCRPRCVAAELITAASFADATTAAAAGAAGVLMHQEPPPPRSCKLTAQFGRSAMRVGVRPLYSPPKPSCLTMPAKPPAGRSTSSSTSQQAARATPVIHTFFFLLLLLMLTVRVCFSIDAAGCVCHCGCEPTGPTGVCVLCAPRPAALVLLLSAQTADIQSVTSSSRPPSVSHLRCRSAECWQCAAPAAAS